MSAMGKAFVVTRNADNGSVTGKLRELAEHELPEGDVTVRVAWSGVNYKDALAASPNGRVVRSYPMVPGIDLAGIVIASRDARFREGDAVLATGYELGTGHYGGFAEIARLPGDWLVPLPAGLSLRDAALLGTAGFTAALSLHRLEEHGLRPQDGDAPVLVTGATGGVGSAAVAMLAARGYAVAAVTGKAPAHAYLSELGAQTVLAREALSPDAGDKRPLRKEQWAGAVDPVGGASLPALLGAIRYGGAVALSGLTGGADFAATVYPFILRGVSLLGIDSVYCPMPLRLRLWERLGTDLKPQRPDLLVHREIGLEQLPEAFGTLLAGGAQGRFLVKIGG
ncbi:oxidoreductase [Paenibacillus chartarius]|uniref:Oxidoreductase n=1 Tax=Paenibacillus chartarius TaxID=747481 RepID=A0ABV6DNA0_9BACL